MSVVKGNTGGLVRLEEVLDTYGGDRARWPAAVRQELSALIANSPEAQKMLADAALFDRLLDEAPAYSAKSHAALADRIVAAAVRQPRAVISNAPAPARRPALRNYGWAPAALAASLLLGIFVGQSSYGDPAAQLLLGASAATQDTSGAQLALTDDADADLEGDVL